MTHSQNNIKLLNMFPLVCFLSWQHLPFLQEIMS